ncbi:polysaccharide deacetylase family sporulation protein PdaB [Virgibacillus natechei]|uniref:Polysaccharide deacetylase family sporulation protein PdaB n=1 Tax=Virgibacillus natechei TaxID=1216297 RepID=A0ABS4IK51_9BACI|nr:polysaccharide deacetylase family sporulation protein PdaB [Virgibacillus natechei]MBP1970940.1 polysaccharide deacetylase family sporulation protein PdaB [Virgibacillus natechei]UZD13317.1 polysaccharide deacetylase family sporulation protein PdaB [Virgibacillus natechei]
MNHFYVWKFDRWKRWLVVLLFALFTATFVWFERDGGLSVFSTNEPVALTKGNANESNIALTFNISWGEEKVFEILEQLEEEQVQATFFLSGEWVERHPDIVESIAEGEHEIGMLGYSYRSYLDQEIDEVRQDLIQAREAFETLNFEDVNLLRTPNGHFNTEIIELAEEMDFEVIHWNVNSNDWNNPGTDVIVDNIMKETTNGDILLMHASDSAKQTANALNTILPGLKNKEFQFVSISELINQTQAEPELVE